jgi:hypothetical protein
MHVNVLSIIVFFSINFSFLDRFYHNNLTNLIHFHVHFNNNFLVS